MENIKNTKHILLVEDEIITAATEKAQLESIGYSITHVTTGEEAITFSLNSNNRIDLILMDIDLGTGINGTETAQKILLNRNVPIVFLSSHTEPEIVKKTEEITSYGYIIKGINTTVLNASLEMAFKLHKSQTTAKENEEKFKRIYDNVSIGIANVSLDFRIQHANNAYCKMLGYEENELIGKSLKEITHVETIEENLKKQRMLAKGEIEHFHLDKKFIHKSGKVVHGILDANLIRDENGKPSYFLGSVVDITSRIENEEKHKFLFENMTQGVVYHDSKGSIIQANKSANKILGLDQSTIKGMSAEDKRWDAINVDFSKCTPDEHPITITLKTKKPVRDKILGIKIPELNKYRWININSTPNFFEGTNSIRNVLITFKDVTKRKEAEEKLKNELLEKDIILKEVHHRIKNNITSIGILLKMQANQIDNSEAKSILNEAQTRVESMKLIYDKLLINNDYNEISISEYMNDLVDAIESSFFRDKSIIINKDIDHILLPVKTVYSLGIIINELITNSMKYAFDNITNPIIDISLKNQETRITLSIKDNGVGLPDNYLSKKTSSGFGISLVKLLAKQLKADIKFDSNNGTECSLTFSSK